MYSQKGDYLMTTPPPSKGRDSVDKIAELFDKYEVPLYADMFEEISKILEQAITEAREEGKREGIDSINALVAVMDQGSIKQEAYEKGLKEGLACAWREIKESYEKGFRECQEKILSYLNENKVFPINSLGQYCTQKELFKEIRSLHPKGGAK